MRPLKSERLATKTAVDGDLARLGDLLHADADQIANAAAILKRPMDTAVRARLEQAAARLTHLAADCLAGADERGPHAAGMPGSGFVELASTRAAAVEDLITCCLRWRDCAHRTLTRGAIQLRANPAASDRALEQIGVVFDAALLSICKAIEVERRETDERLGFLATHDPLTRLPNRALVAERLDQLRRRPDRAGFAIVFLDLDNFKTVNDTLGHGAGDELLCQVTARLQASVRPGDVIGRMGGDEFVVVVDHAESLEAPQRIAERLLGAFREPFVLADGRARLRVSASIGIASSDVSTPETLLREADLAMYQAKALGKDRAELAPRLLRKAS